MSDCIDCGKPLSAEEIHYLEFRCEVCETAWCDRIGAWIKGETIEPELDAFYSGRRQ